MAEITTNETALPRFNGLDAWNALQPEEQAAIGAIALELVVNINGEDAYFSGLEAQMPEARPFIAAQPFLMDMLIDAAQEALRETVPALNDDALPVPIPSLLGQVCRVCRCSQDDACDEGCGWAEDDLCSACVTEPA